MPRLYTLLHQNVLDVFNEYGVQIMTPAYRADTDLPKLVERKDWYPLRPGRRRSIPPQSAEPLAGEPGTSGSPAPGRTAVTTASQLR
ncbi:MAG: hypothetical protein R2862_08930 [Thermoanaerobaculia bacterium]